MSLRGLAGLTVILRGIGAQNCNTQGHHIEYIIKSIELNKFRHGYVCIFVISSYLTLVCICFQSNLMCDFAVLCYANPPSRKLIEITTKLIELCAILG